MLTVKIRDVPLQLSMAYGTLNCKLEDLLMVSCDTIQIDQKIRMVGRMTNDQATDQNV